MSDSDGTVIINGNVVNVPQKLALLRRSEVERDQAKAAVAEHSALIGTGFELRSRVPHFAHSCPI